MRSSDLDLYHICDLYGIWILEGERLYLLFIIFVYKNGEKESRTQPNVGFHLMEKNRKKRKKPRKEHSDGNVFH